MMTIAIGTPKSPIALRAWDKKYYFQIIRLLTDTNILSHIVTGAHDAEEVGDEEGAEHEEHGEEGGVRLPGHWVRKGATRFPCDV